MSTGQECLRAIILSSCLISYSPLCNHHLGLVLCVSITCSCKRWGSFWLHLYSTRGSNLLFQGPHKQKVLYFLVHKRSQPIWPYMYFTSSFHPLIPPPTSCPRILGNSNFNGSVYTLLEQAPQVLLNSLLLEVTKANVLLLLGWCKGKCYSEKLSREPQGVNFPFLRFHDSIMYLAWKQILGGSEET